MLCALSLEAGVLWSHVPGKFLRRPAEPPPGAASAALTGDPVSPSSAGVGRGAAGGGDTRPSPSVAAITLSPGCTVARFLQRCQIIVLGVPYFPIFYR